MYYQIKGLVLNSRTQGESDKIALIYSYEWGKISSIVPSAKKITAKLNGATEPLTESEFMVYQNHSSMRPKITGAQILNNHTKLKSDFQKSIYALYAAEIGDKLLPFNSANIEKYYLISRIWQVLEDCANFRRAIAAFTLRFLSLSGYSFSDYIKQGNTQFDKESQTIINKLSNCSGDDLDSLSINDEIICYYVEEYLLNYIKTPSVHTFLKKIKKHL